MMSVAQTLLLFLLFLFLLPHCRNTASKHDAPSDNTPKGLSFDLPDTKTKTYPGKEFEEQLKAHAEKTAKKKYYTPLIAVYQKLLAKEPDNPALKKRLGLAYFYIEEYEQALPLLESLKEADKEALDAIQAIKRKK